MKKIIFAAIVCCSVFANAQSPPAEAISDAVAKHPHGATQGMAKPKDSESGVFPAPAGMNPGTHASRYTSTLMEVMPKRNSAWIPSDWPAASASIAICWRNCKVLWHNTVTKSRGPGMSTSAKELRFDDYTMWVELADGRTLGVPLAWFPRLLHTKHQPNAKPAASVSWAMACTGRRLFPVHGCKRIPKKIY